MFATRGKIQGNLELFFKVGFEIDYFLDTIFVGVEKRFNIANKTLLDLTSGCSSAGIGSTTSALTALTVMAGDPATGQGAAAADGGEGANRCSVVTSLSRCHDRR